MEKQTKKPFIIIIVLLSVTAAILILQPQPELVDTSVPLRNLPEELDNYTIDNILFCQNEACMSAHLGKDAVSNLCPACSGILDGMSVGEKRLLSKDSTLERRIYYKPGENKYVVSIVTSGRDRTSIHTPQTCLKGQGYNILDQYPAVLDLADRRPLKIMILNLKKELPSQTNSQYFLYAYWFVSKEYETPYHIKRILLMAFDNLFRGRSSRWAYVSVMVTTTETYDGRAELEDFIATIYTRCTIQRD